MQFTIVLAALATALAFIGGDKKPADAPAAGRVEKVDELGLTLTIPAAFGTLKDVQKSAQVRAGWSGKLGGADLVIFVYALPNSEFGFKEPEDVGDIIRKNVRDQDPSFAYEKSELVSGPVGFAPYAGLAWGPMHAKDGVAVEKVMFLLGGLLENQGYALQVLTGPKLKDADKAIVLDFLKTGVKYAGNTRDSQWSPEEAKARWASDAPPNITKKMEKPVRTKHYIFLSNTDAAKQMGEHMEKAYDAIQLMYPFDEVEGRRLLPVFLFANQNQYYDFFAKTFNTSVEVAATSKGVAYADFYATYYDSPRDPVHIHEMTHQVFANRLRLGGGGSWFQEGVAEYICTKATERTDAVNLVKKEKHVKLPALIGLESLLAAGANDRKQSGQANALYLQAATLIEFVRESPWSKGKFLEWVHAMGNCPSNNEVAIERATKTVLGVDIAGLEAKYVEYCKKR